MNVFGDFQGHMTWCLPVSFSRCHFEYREGPGDEVGDEGSCWGGGGHLHWQIQRSSKGAPDVKMVFSCLKLRGRARCLPLIRHWCGRLRMIQKTFSSIACLLEFCISIQKNSPGYQRFSCMDEKPLVHRDLKIARLTNTMSKTFHHIGEGIRSRRATNEWMIEKFKCWSSLCWIALQGSLQKWQQSRRHL